MANEAESDKSKLGLVLAVVAGLLAMGMVFVFLQKMKRDAGAGATSTAAAPSYETQSVLVAVRDLPSGHVLSVNKDLKGMEIPVSEQTEAFAKQCVPAKRASELEGRRLGVGISAQFPLLFSNLVDSARIDDDFTDGFLKTIEVEQVNLIGNQLIPGDRVMILATLPKKPGKEPTPPPADASGNQLNSAAITQAILQSMPNMNRAGAEVETVMVLENAEVFLLGSMRKVDRVQMGYMPAKRNATSEITLHLNITDALRLTQFENTPGAKLTFLLCPRKKGNE